MKNDEPSLWERGFACLAEEMTFEAMAEKSEGQQIRGCLVREDRQTTKPVKRDLGKVEL